MIRGTGEVQGATVETAGAARNGTTNWRRPVRAIAVASLISLFDLSCPTSCPVSCAILPRRVAIAHDRRPCPRLHLRVISRLNGEDHPRPVTGMIEEGRPCVDGARQGRRVERVTRHARQTLIHDHMDHCLDAEETGDRAQPRAIAC